VSQQSGHSETNNFELISPIITHQKQKQKSKEALKYNRRPSKVAFEGEKSLKAARGEQTL
jgi:hypothetical protein